MRIIISSLFLLASFEVMAWPFDGKLNYYKCPTSEAAHSCNSFCNKVLGGQMQFKVEQARNIVIYTAFKDGEVASSGTYNNCKVIDSKNWICKDDETTSSAVIISESKMNNGIYAGIWMVLPANRGAKIPSSYSCAK